MSSIDRELVVKIVKLGVSKVKAKRIVRNLSAEQKSSKLKDASSLRAITDIEHREWTYRQAISRCLRSHRKQIHRK